MHHFSSISTAIAELKKGNMLIVVDDRTRENQGDIIFPAESITTDKANFLMKECRGMFCVPMTKELARKLQIPLMISKKDNTEKLKCNFTITVDAKNVKSFGISASDRALTVKILSDPHSKPTDLVRPGHVSPIIAADGKLLERDGHTEAAVTLAKLAGFSPIGVLSEIIRDDGEVARPGDLIRFSKKHNIKIIQIKDLVIYIKNCLKVI